MINNVFIWGSKSNTLLGNGALIGAGKVVTKNLRKNSFIVGNPGKHVKINKHLYDEKILASQK